MPLSASSGLTQVFRGRPRGRVQCGLVWCRFGAGSYVDSEFEGHAGWNVRRESPGLAEEGMAPSGDDVSDVGETRALRDRDIGDEVAPAYPKQSTLASHVKGLQFPP